MEFQRYFKSREVSKPRDWVLWWSYQSEIWKAYRLWSSPIHVLILSFQHHPDPQPPLTHTPTQVTFLFVWYFIIRVLFFSLSILTCSNVTYCTNVHMILMKAGVVCVSSCWKKWYTWTYLQGCVDGINGVVWWNVIRFSGIVLIYTSLMSQLRLS